jgi:uncharacterized peroxidase-related enzyme
MPKLPESDAAALASGPYGSLFSVIGVRPRIAESLARHLRDVGESGTVPRRTKELVALMVSWLNVCVVCAKSHEALARHLGVDQETLDALEDYTRSEKFSPAERTALSASVALTREPRALPPAIRDQLRAHYDEGEVLEILATIGLYNYVNRLHNALEVDVTPEMRGCEP